MALCSQEAKERDSASLPGAYVKEGAKLFTFVLVIAGKRPECGRLVQTLGKGESIRRDQGEVSLYLSFSTSSPFLSGSPGPSAMGFQWDLQAISDIQYSVG